MVGEASTAKHLEYVTKRCAQLEVEIATIDEMVRIRVRVMHARPDGDALHDPVFNALTSAITLMRQKHQEFERTRLELVGVREPEGDE